MRSSLPELCLSQELSSHGCAKFLLLMGHHALDSGPDLGAPSALLCGMLHSELSCFLEPQRFNILTSSSTNTKSKVCFLSSERTKTKKQKETPKQEKQTKIPQTTY